MKPLYVTHDMCLATSNFPLEYKTHKKESPSGLLMRGFIFPGKRKMTVGMWVCLYVMREFGFQSFVFESNLNAIILQKGVML